MELRGLNVFPIKSCRGVALPAGVVTPRGLAQDRRWMIVDAQGDFMTQRDYPHMAKIHVSFGGGSLRLAREGAAALDVPAALAAGERRQVRVWSSTMDAIVHAPATAWVSEALGQPCQLVYMPDDVARPVNPARSNPGDIVSFADAYPFLVVGQASLDDLNQRIGAELAMARFRPNLVVAGGEPYAEDRWTRVRIGEVTFRNAKLCDRCVLTTVDPETGVKGPEPLRTLAKYRAWDGQVWFGANLIAENLGEIRVGDAVTPL